jgi:LmbE family N-acetylglucosaminyl deacetylase
MSALTTGQKQHLAILAREAYAAAPQSARDAMDLNDYRRREVAKACGKMGLRCATQLDYKNIEAHLLHLLGRDAQALKSYVKAQTEPRRQAMVILQRECNKAGLHISYAQKIARNKNHGLGLDDLNETALWKIIYTVRNRRPKTTANQPF